MLNSTHQKDWESVYTLAKQINALFGDNTMIVPSFGYHPWYLNLATPEWEHNLRQFIIKVQADQEIKQFHIGQIGVDTSKNCKQTPLQTQLQFVSKQLKIAEEFNKLTTMHCVFCQDYLIKHLKLLQKEGMDFKNRIILHSFQGSSKHIKKLKEFQCYFSISLGCLTSRHCNMISKIPNEYLLVQSDTPSLFNLQIVQKYNENESLQRDDNKKFINQSKYIPYVLKQIAELKGEEYVTVMQQAYENSVNLLDRFN